MNRSIKIKLTLLEFLILKRGEAERIKFLHEIPLRGKKLVNYFFFYRFNTFSLSRVYNALHRTRACLCRHLYENRGER